MLANTHAHGSGTIDDPHDSWLGVARDTDAEAGPVALLHHQALGLLQDLGLHARLLLVHVGFVVPVERKRIIDFIRDIITLYFAQALSFLHNLTVIIQSLPSSSYYHHII